MLPTIAHQTGTGARLTPRAVSARRGPNQTCATGPPTRRIPPCRPVAPPRLKLLGCLSPAVRELTRRPHRRQPPPAHTPSKSCPGGVSAVPHRATSANGARIHGFEEVHPLRWSPPLDPAADPRLPQHLVARAPPRDQRPTTASPPVSAGMDAHPAWEGAPSGRGGRWSSRRDRGHLITAKIGELQADAGWAGDHHRHSRRTARTCAGRRWRADPHPDAWVSAQPDARARGDLSPPSSTGPG